MRNRILGAIGVLWGGGILLSRLLAHRTVEGSGGYATGQVVALVFAALLFSIGLYYLIKGDSKAKRVSP